MARRKRQPRSQPTELTVPVAPVAPVVDAKAVALVLRQLSEGFDEPTIRSYLAEQHADADHDAALRAAINELRADAEPDPDLVRGFAIRAYREVYRRALRSSDFTEARHALQALLDLAGVKE